MGTKEVHAISEDGEFFKTKGKIKLGNKYEILCHLVQIRRSWIMSLEKFILKIAHILLNLKTY